MKYFILLFIGILLIPFAIQAQQDTILIYKTDKSVQKIYPLPGTWRVYRKDGKVDEFPNASLKVQKITVPVEENMDLLSETKVYPQPFNNSINIEFELMKDANVDFEIFNQSGQIIFNSSNNFMLMGKNSFTWNGKDNLVNNVQSGTYYLKIKQGNVIFIEKLLLIK